ncbi:hypothetical protein [Allorhizocola rhizosphaerae]|nr:hypothetical protein [Allorhizocola rhizosphaerae]
MFTAALIWLVATGHTSLATSADSVRGTPLWAVLAPLDAGVLPMWF